MPRYNELEVTGGDRGSLLRFAAVATLLGGTKPEGRTRRGAPQLPERLAAPPHNFTQTRFTQLLRSGPLLEQKESVLAAIDESEDRRLVELYRTLRAAKDPDSVASGVNGEFWTVLRRLGTSRHPIDAVIGASSAVNYLSEVAARGESVSRRDILAVGRLQRGLCQIALRNYPFSSKALDLIAVLCRWEVDAPLGYMTSVPTGRRISRAFDRAIRTYVGGQLMDPEAFSVMFRQIAEKAVGRPLKSAQTSTTSTSALLRLVRVIARFESDEDAGLRRGSSSSFTGDIVDALARIASPFSLERDKREKVVNWASERQVAIGVADIVVRREAIFTLYEMQLGSLRKLAAVDGAIQSAIGDIHKNGEQHLFADIIDWFSGRGGARDIDPVESLDEHRLHRAPNFPDLVTDSSLNAASWDIARTSFADVVERHLPLSESLVGTSWRGLTRQVAVATRDLMRELVVVPSSARARTIAETLQASGNDVTRVAAAVLEDLLVDSMQSNATPVAKRCAWAIGFLGQATPTMLRRTLVPALNGCDALDRSVVADVAWAIGDILAAEPTCPGRDEAMKGLAAVVDEACERMAFAAVQEHQLTRGVDPSFLVVAQAATHALAIQADPDTGALLTRVADTARLFSDRAPAGGVTGSDWKAPKEQGNRLFKFAEWGLLLLDQPSLLSQARW